MMHPPPPAPAGSPPEDGTACPLCAAEGADAFYREDERDLMRCAGCGLLYASPMRSPEGARQDERWESRYGELGTKTEALGTRRARASIFRALFRRPAMRGRTGTVLDVGCADGHFLGIAREHGWTPVGVDLSETACRFVRERYGMEAHAGSLGEIPLGAGRFDLVTFWDVLEHMRDPVAALREASRLLRPGGLVFLRVPNARYLRLKYHLWVRGMGRRKCFIPLVHWYNFDTHTLDLAFARAGLRPTGYHVGPPEVYGPALRRAVQYGFYGMASALGPRSPFCFALEAFAHPASSPSAAPAPAARNGEAPLP